MSFSNMSRFVLIAAVILIVLLIALVWHFKPLPPGVVYMTTGSPGGFYDQVAQKYKKHFADAGIDLRLVPSNGAVENLNRLNDPNSNISVGFVQGGLTDQNRSPGLVSLGTVFYEPIWFFSRGVDVGRRLEALRGHKISIGPENSGTHSIVMELLRLNGIDPSVAPMIPLTASESGVQLLSGDISGAIMVASWDTPIVRKLVADPLVDLASFTRADAYVALYPYLTKLILPQGVGNMAANRPPADVILVSTEASLVIRKNLSPPIQYLLLDAATEIHSGPGIFQRAGQFPAPHAVDIPISKEAMQFYKSGIPFLQRHLPFRVAAAIESLAILLIPILGVLYPLVRVAPAAYAWNTRRRIFNLYGEVKLIELEMESPTPTPVLIQRLNKLEERAMHMRISNMFAQFSYVLRQHIDLVRARLMERK